LFLHGFSEYIERYDHVFSNFAERGIKTFAWDQRGFGKSAIKKSEWGVTGGIDKALQDIDHFVKQVKQESQTAQIPLFLWGHSMVYFYDGMRLMVGWGTCVVVCF
jgi:acylglycerol lipase